MKKDSTSLFTPYIDEMLDFKVCLGYERKTYESFLNDFSRYCAKYYPIEECLTKELVLAWCMRRPSESPSGFRRRIIVVREFAKYMESIGQESYILPSCFAGGRVTFTPYIFSDEELATFFSESDSMELNRRSPYRHVILPVMLRMIYFCGLRPNEGREIQKNDVNLNDGVLFIRKNKSHRERYVPMSEDMRNLCVSYNEKLRFFAPESEFFFPNTIGIPYSAKWLTRQFLGIWEKIRNNQCPKRARVYDLRHRFATTVMMQWLNDGADLYAKLPYLSTYMGHSQFSNTAYYIHLLPENLLHSPGMDWESFSELIPEVESW
ncbi:tyrosine-type recombinase/integrase [Clostridium estertheticum]|uniref:tyrosine-type recombinase/integrase n=1 Tax=Clostridium estertheticum TaxID=238834 RepID=UPI001C6E5B4D|nr:tyrosine-type recombinase/integrase [Clostridium estertheticum]MBW9154797.1 tyrosine-type recombinase/integrase [Clostridium estertheticum]WLC83564.1 tyrosine-type recombinase/integrase [Clostridium estertheticum]WLC83713.1 tyrosine-type recombinase/integrase [Clostridium estertheticum]